jgi:hypothetical protein
VQSRGVLALTGPAVTPDGMVSFAMEVKPLDRWIYCESVGARVTVYSGSPCGKCRLLIEGLMRCQEHANLVWVARQYDLLDSD